VRQVSDRLDVLAAVGKASAARLDKAAPANQPDGDINPPNSLLRRAPAPPRDGGGGGSSSFEDEAGWGRAAANPIRRRVQLSDGDADGEEGDPPQTPTTQLLAATADILAAVASSRAAGKPPARLRPDVSVLGQENGSGDLGGLPAQYQMGGAALQGAGRGAGAGRGVGGMEEGDGVTYALNQKSVPPAKRTVAAAHVARLDSSMQMHDLDDDDDADVQDLRTPLSPEGNVVTPPMTTKPYSIDLGTTSK